MGLDEWNSAEDTFHTMFVIIAYEVKIVEKKILLQLIKYIPRAHEYGFSLIKMNTCIEEL